MFLFDMVMIAVYPIMSTLLRMNDISYGIWEDTSVNNTASVVISGCAFDAHFLREWGFPTMVKLTCSIDIISTVLGFAYIRMHIKRWEM